MIVKDNIYGTIEFDELEERIINTAEFQRLRRIKQMSITNLVYPGANHTRFEHSLGTAHLAEKIAEKLVDNREERKMIKLYALLHDIGHVAFSHEGEDVLKRYLGDHEKIAKDIILKTQIADIINENFNVKKILEIEEKGSGAIVDGDIGADRMDYLKRDALNTGVAYGIIDIDRLVHTTRLVKNEMCITEGGLEAAEWLLVARFMMFSAVYLHKTVRIATVMVHKAIEHAIRDNTIKPEEFIWIGDEFALAKMRESPGAREYVDRIIKRRLYKEVAVIREKDLTKKEAEKLENELKEKFGIDIIFDYPTQFFKPIKLKVLKKNNALVPISNLSDLVSSLNEAEEKRKKIMIITSEENKKKYGKKIQKELENFLS